MHHLTKVQVRDSMKFHGSLVPKGTKPGALGSVPGFLTDNETLQFNCTTRIDVDEVRATARTHWPEIHEHLGIDQRFLKNRHGPCPACGGRDRFRYDNKDGRGTFYCNNCGAGDGFKLLMNTQGWSFREALQAVAEFFGIGPKAPVAYRSKPDFPVLGSSTSIVERNRDKLKRTWRQCTKVTPEDPVWIYLLDRGLHLNAIPNVIRYHPELPYFAPSVAGGQYQHLGNYPAMVTAIQSAEGKVIGIHRTYLNPGGRGKLKLRDPQNAKELLPAKKIQVTQPGALMGSAIRLILAGKILALAEGIETALAIHLATGLPVWATVTASGMAKLVLPNEVQQVFICADLDLSGTGESAARILAGRLLREGLDARIVRVPADIPQGAKGIDFADLLKGGVR